MQEAVAEMPRIATEDLVRALAGQHHLDATSRRLGQQETWQIRRIRGGRFHVPQDLGVAAKGCRVTHDTLVRQLLPRNLGQESLATCLVIVG
jgi:hypothetical protein